MPHSVTEKAQHWEGPPWADVKHRQVPGVPVRDWGGGAVTSDSFPFLSVQIQLMTQIIVALPEPPHVIYFRPQTQEPSLSLFPHTTHIITLNSFSSTCKLYLESNPSHHGHPTVQSASISCWTLQFSASLPPAFHAPLSKQLRPSTSHPLLRGGKDLSFVSQLP